MVMEDEKMAIQSNTDNSKLDLNIAAEVELISEEKTPYEMLRDSKSSIEEIVAQILEMKKIIPTPKSQLRELCTQIFLHIVTLRQANRGIMIEADKVKSELDCAKAPLDMAMLQLHELKYERSHYLKAMETCKVFNSEYPNIEEFSRDSPQHIVMMKRLNYELYQRKELCNLHEKLKSRKKSLMETVASRKKFLSSLPSHLKSLKKASLPVQNQLGIQHADKLKQHQLAELLPQPLYVVYSQFLAQKEAFGENIDVEILGSVKDAQSFARQQANNDTGVATTMESLGLDGNAQDEEDDDQSRRKRPRKENFDQTRMCEVHPLRVILHIYDPESSDPKPTTTLVTLNFEYLLKLNVVCVGVEGSHENNILCNLFPDDTGFELPHQSGKLIVGDALAFDEKRSSRPYKWAQHLAGIDILPEVSPLQVICETKKTEAAKTEDVIAGLALHRQHNLVQTFVQRIRSETKAQQALV